MLAWFEQLSKSVSDAVTDLLGPTADFLVGYVWNWPPQAPILAILLLGTGLFVTIRLGLIQLRGFRHAIDITRGKYDNPDDEGDIKHFQALTTALSATVGIGNIAGVAIAIRMGGPGAVFWMWVTAFFGMALKFAECTLAQRYRKVHADGSVSGGPMYYMEQGLGKWGRWMAVAFATFAVICSFGTGNMNQSNTMADAVEARFGIHPVWTAIVFSIVVGMVIIGGIRRIGRVTGFLAPFMALLYVGAAMIVLILNIEQIPGTFALIVKEAFMPSSMAGGAAGSFLMTLMWGVRRGLFSNEAGQGSAPIAHAAAKTDEPVREGLVALLEPFIDTLVICTMTALVILMSGVWKEKVPTELTLGAVTAEALTGVAGEVIVRDGRSHEFDLVHLAATVDDVRFVAADGSPWSGVLTVTEDGSIRAGEGIEAPTISGRALLTGAPLTAYGFRTALPGKNGDMIVTLAVLLFAVSTAISWSYYGDRATEYLLGPRWIPYYRWVYVFFFFLGAILPLSAVWTFGDVALGLMSFPNLLTLILLSGTTVALVRDYYSRDHKPYK